MNKKAWKYFLVAAIIVTVFIAKPNYAWSADSSTSKGRYEMLSTTSGQYAETYMLDKYTGRVWAMRGQVSSAPFMIACIYQLSDKSTALSPLDEGQQSDSVSERYLMKSATSGQYAETYVLDKQSGRVWIMRGQVSKSPYLIPCAYQISNDHAALSPLDKNAKSVKTNERFAMLCVTSGNYAETYVNDVENGNVWKMRGQVSQSPFLTPCAYELVNGEAISTPMERHSEIKLLGSSASPQSPEKTSDFPASDPLLPELQKKLDDASKKADEDINKLFTPSK